jgi:hypothetical protein
LLKEQSKAKEYITTLGEELHKPTIRLLEAEVAGSNMEELSTEELLSSLKQHFNEAM